MDKSWTDVALVIFTWIGGGAAIVLLVLQFGTRLLQSDCALGSLRTGGAACSSDRSHDCAIRGRYSGQVMGVAFAAVAITHVLLFIGYGLFKNGVICNAGLLVYCCRDRFHADRLGGSWEPVL